MSTSDVTVTLRAKDEISPVIRRLTAQVWLMGHAGTLLALLIGFAFIIGLLIGRFVA